MKLYATVTSERATKGQGGNDYIDVNLSANLMDLIKIKIKQVSPDEFKLYITNVFLGNTKQIYYDRYYIAPKLGETIKGNKQKDDCEIDDSTEHLCVGVGCKNH